MTTLWTRIITRASKTIYDKCEVIVFCAPPWNEAESSKIEAEVIPVVQSHGSIDLPPFVHGVEHEFGRRMAWKSRRDDVCYLLLLDGLGVGFGWARTTGKIKIEEIGLSLALDSSQVCLFDFFIAPSVRGRGLYTRLLREIRRRSTKKSVLIYADSWNVPSLAGISAAGFSAHACVRGLTLFGGRFPTGVSLFAKSGLAALPQ